MKDKISLFWFRRDLRLDDNVGLYHALQNQNPVLPIYIFDKNVIDQYQDKSNKKIQYIYEALRFINEKLKINGSSLLVDYGEPIEIFKKLVDQYQISEVYYNSEYEPKTLKRDLEIISFLKSKKVKTHEYKDHLIFEKSEILKSDCTPYTVYSYYAKQWKKKLADVKYESYDVKDNFYKFDLHKFISLEEIGFSKSDYTFEEPKIDIEILVKYDQNRDFPNLDATSKLGVALRYGTISIRECVKLAHKYSEVWLNELIWREFFSQILFQFPVVENRSFKIKYENIIWENNEELFHKWCQGKTGVPIVDAGMNQLNRTGFMHNRVRMIVASFLTKNLLIDWRWGEAYFAEKLLDYDLASNNGNWQWAAGCGCDASPYFRVFNPILQTQKFDKNFEYIKKWNSDYLNNQIPIIDLVASKNKAIEIYRNALKE